MTEIQNRFSCARLILNHHTNKDSFLSFSDARFFSTRKNLRPAENYAMAMISSLGRFTSPLRISGTTKRRSICIPAMPNSERRIAHPHAATHIASLSAAAVTVPTTNRGLNEPPTKEIEEGDG
jgi:hypothetical protein